MKTPIDGARISSGFGMRFHPILGYTKMHKGIDFAAPRGTPIYAAGDGTIEKAGKFSSYGNYVRIRHRAGLETAYAHMQGFHAGIRPGSRVKQGQVIGYVGTTGRSTGPHLHYEILIGGKQVNPAGVKLAGGRSLGGKELKGFRQVVGSRDAEFAKALKPAAAAVAEAN
jgi:murein DD-endopeptidase MepM/ murein hydrolase activator NlpD